MRIAYLDCFSGISGDMFLGALVAAGVPLELLHETVAALDLGARLEASPVMRSGISSTKVDVIVNGEKDLPREVYQEKKGKHLLHHTHSGEPEAEADHHHSHPHEHKHGHGHEHGHKHGHEHRHKHAHESSSPAIAGLPHAHHAHEHGRSLKQIRQLISHAPISPAAKATALAIFEALGRVEAGIHQVPVDDIHFHEVGSADAIIDITCAAVGAEALGVQEWVCSPINVGGGVVQCAHGTFPVPAPATLELLRACHAPVFASGVDKELATPTGAAIVSVLARRFAPFPAMKIDRIGYGAGYRDLPGHANVLRLTVGEIDSTDPQSSETVTVIEANLDDISPQVIGYVFDRALAEGALDVFTLPLQMKKSRPGMLLTVLTRPQDADRLAGLLFAETTTLGVRMRQESRQCLDRKHVNVSTPWGEIRLKLGMREGKITNFSPEYEDCRRAAAEHKVPLKSVMQEAIRLYLEKHHHE